MIKKCTPDFITQLEQYVSDDKIKSLAILKQEDGLFANYYLETTENLNTDLSLRLKVASTLHELSNMLILDKVHSFSLTYVPEEQKNIVSQSYLITSQEISRDKKLEVLKEKLALVKTLVQDIGIGDIVIKEIFEKAPKSVSSGTNTKQRKDSGTRYQETNIENIINKVIEEI